MYSFILSLLRPGMMLIMISLFSLSASAQIPGLGDATEAETVDINALSKEEADRYLAGLSDAEARKLLLKQIEDRPPPVEMSMMGESYISYAIMSLHDRSRMFELELKKISDARQDYGSTLSRRMNALFYTEGESALLKVFSTLALLLAIGGIATTMAFRPMHQFRDNLRQNGHFPVYLRLGRSLTGIVYDLLKIGLFLLVTVPLTLVIFDQESSLRAFATSIFILVAAIWMVRDVLKELLFSPICKELFIKGERSRTIYYWSMLGFFSCFAFAILSSALLTILKFPSELIRLNTLVIVTFSTLSLIIGVFMITYAKYKHDDGSPDALRTAVSNNRYWLVVLMLVAFYIIGFKNIVIAENLTADQRLSPGYTYYALLMFIFMPMYLRVIKLLIVVQPIKDMPVNMLADEDEDDARFHTDDDHVLRTSEKSNKWIRLVFTLPYMILIILFTLEGANIGLLSWFSDGAGSEFGEAATGVFLACMLGVIAWNMVNTYINKNLPKVALDPKALMNGEGGGSDAATRTQTVLPIVRNFALVLIVIMVLFSVLSALNINTAPLLAGAGVMGLAIGFGAQKLVQDVVSGMFFLFEDAFRIGEYIDTGSLVGTVESTSVRSLKLRHHLGAVQTVPYGEIRSVKNLSRDFVIMKLSFRVPFDTDIELVRRTIKKVGQAMLQHEELGPDFIAPLKSQGVQTAEDDALLIRMKFTAKPGKQWVIRREAYRLVKDALEKKGITFATRQVTVHIPENEHLDPAKVQQAAGAAIAAEQQKLPNKKPDPMADM